MAYAAEILGLLLDRYERSGHCLPDRASSRGVSLSFTRGEYPPYRENDPRTADVNSAVEALEGKGLVSAHWRKGYEGWLYDRVYLNLDKLPEAYSEIGRTPLRESADSLHALLEQSARAIRTQWKLDFIKDELSNLQRKLRLSRLLPGDGTQVGAILRVLQYTERGPELMRVISANCFHDSKFLKGSLLSQLISIAKAYEPELAAYRAAGDELLTDGAALEQIGILTYPEIFEFCGNIGLCFARGPCSAGAFKRGFCLQSENVEYISGVDLTAIKTILFIENRTNYRAAVLQGVRDDMLAVYHGGFYSPAKRKLFRMLKTGAPPSTETLFWGDIDLGGFLMFTRLKRNIFPNLAPWRMGIEDYNAYKNRGTRRSPAYLASLKQHTDEKQIDAALLPVARAIISSGVTFEQELML